MDQRYFDKASPLTKSCTLRGGRLTKWKGKVASIAHIVGVATVFSGLYVGAASAENECGINTLGPTILTCAAGNYTDGITYITTSASMTNAGDGLTLILNDPGIVISGSLGVQLRTANENTENIAVNALSFGSITTTATFVGRGFWIENRGTAGNVDVVIGLDAGSIQTNGIQSYGALASVGRLGAVGNVSASWWAGDYTSLGEQGIVTYAFSRGTGTTHSEMNGGAGDLSGLNSTGVLSLILNPDNSSAATASFTGGSLDLSGPLSNGVRAWTTGLGSASASMSGGTITMSGNGGSGIQSRIDGLENEQSSTVTVTGGTIIATGRDTIGAFVRNQGTGVANVFVNGNSIINSSGQNAFGIATVGATYAVKVEGTAFVAGGSGSGAGIRTFSTANSTGTIMIGADAIVKGAAGIRDGAGNTIVTTAGTVTGDAILGMGDDVFNLTGGVYTGDIYGDDVVASENDGNDTFNWSGGDLSSNFYGGNGDDSASISAGANYEGNEVMDGGGGVDSLVIAGHTLAIAPSAIINFENVTVDTGTLSFTDNALSVGAATGQGLALINGARLDAGTSFVLTGNLRTSSGGVFDGTGAGVGTYTIDGNVLNNGYLTMQDGVVGDNITIAGDYSGRGELWVDINTSLNTSDLLTIQGNSGGVSVIRVNNLSPFLASGVDIPIVLVEGISAVGDVILGAGSVVAGAFTYTLGYQAVATPVEVMSRMAPTLVADTGPTLFTTSIPAAGTYYLKSEINSTGAVYEAAPSILGTFNRLPTLEQRVGQRQWTGQSGAETAGQPLTGAWVRFTGDKLDATTTTGSSIASKTWGLQTGADFAVEPGDAGQWVLGITGQYGKMSSTVTSALGFGTIDAEGFGVGATATWYGNTGTYVDLQGQVNWIDSDISSSVAGALVKGQSAKAYALSAEVGHRFALNETSALVPQAQLTWGRIDGGSFTDSAGNAVDLGSHGRTIGRLGLAYEYAPDTAAGGNPTKAYVIGNILHDFSGDSSVKVGGASLSTGAAEKTWGEIGVGGSYTFDANKTLYGEAAYRTSFGGSSANNGLSATVGLRIQW